MTQMSLRLPNSLHADVKELAAQDEVSLNQFISQAVAEKVAVLKQADAILKRRSNPKVSRAEVQSLLEGVGNDEVISGDELPESWSSTSK